MMSSFTLAETRSLPENAVTSSGGDCRRSARFVRKPTDIRLTLLFAAVANIARYSSTGVGVVDVSFSVRGQLYAILLAYSPELQSDQYMLEQMRRSHSRMRPVIEEHLLCQRA